MSGFARVEGEYYALGEAGRIAEPQRGVATSESERELSRAHTPGGRRAKNLESTEGGRAAGFDSQAFEYLEDVFLHGGFAVAENCGDVRISFALGQP